MTRVFQQLFIICAILAFAPMVHAQMKWLPAEPGVRKDAVVADRLLVRIQPWVPRYLHGEILERVGLKIHHAILPYEQSLTSDRSKAGDDLLNVDRAVALEEPLLRSYVVEFDADVPPEKMISMVRPVCSDIEVCETVAIPMLTGEPNDPQIDQQDLLRTLNMYEAWDIEEGDRNVIIGISDSGVLQEHEDLTENIFVNEGEIPNNGIDDDGNGHIDDHRGTNFAYLDDGTDPGNTNNSVEGHGTGVAGIAGATVNNGIGIAGVGGSCTIWPLKAMPEGVPGIVYGYESIMYCALNDIDVVNCSWGGFSSSCINQSIIDYAVARGVAVVAAAGNHGTATPFYPGAYNGVLNVGVTNPADDVISMTGHGPTVDIMAPGQQTWTTSSDSTYGGFCCTSGSSPIVAGVVALVLSQRPSLTGLEACAVVREMGEPVKWSNVPENVEARLLPLGRVDGLASLKAPSQLVSLDVIETVITTTSTDPRWSVGDSIDVQLRAVNVGSPFTIDLFTRTGVIAGDQPSLVLIGENTSVVDQQVNSGDTILLPSIRVEVVSPADTSEYVEAEVTAIDENDSTQVRIVRTAVLPTPPYRDLENNVLGLSVGDRARIGNVDLDKGQGVGFNFKEWCGQLYEGGLMITMGGKVVDAVRAVRSRNDHFAPVKRFERPQPFTSVVSDADAPDSMRMGVEVQQEVFIGGPDSAYFVTDITVTNVSNIVMQDLAIGWFYDFDLGSNPAQNTTDLGATGRAWAEQYVRSTNAGEPTVIVGSISGFNDAVPVSVGVDNTITYRGTPPEQKIAWLLSGTNSQYSDTNDVAAVNGMRFTQPIPPGQSRSFRHYIAIGDDESPSVYRDAIISDYRSSIDNGQSSLGSRYMPRPNPASDFTQIDVPTSAERVIIRVFTMDGVQALPDVSVVSHGNVSTINLDVRSLAIGQYVLHVIETGPDGQQRRITGALTILR